MPKALLASHRTELKKNDMFVIPHDPYLPDLTPCDFFILPLLKLILKGQHLGDLDGIKQKLAEYLQTLTSEDFQRCFNNWKIRLLKCAHYMGEYFEGDKCILEWLQIYDVLSTFGFEVFGQTVYLHNDRRQIHYAKSVVWRNMIFGVQVNVFMWRNEDSQQC